MSRFLVPLVLLLIPLHAGAQSSSIDPNPPMSRIPRGIEDGAITFSEFAVGTPITDQYQDRGILFGGDAPFITTDGSNPTSPVLSGSPIFQGDIIGTFVDPDSGEPRTVRSFELDAGYFDELASTRIEWFDPDGLKLGQIVNVGFGVEKLTAEGGNIASWRIGIIKTEPAGFAIDNVVFEPVGSSVLFREKSDETKEGTWGFSKDEIPGFDHVGLHVSDIVYESHPGYPAGTYRNADGSEMVSVAQLNGVQSEFTRSTFEHDSKLASTTVVDFEEIPIDESLAGNMRDAIETRRGAGFQFIDYSASGLSATLSPSAQKGGGGTFTCVGLVEWSAEQAGKNGGQGFIPNSLESFSIPDFSTFPPGKIIVPLLSPELLNYAMKGEQLFENTTQWVQGLFDPIDFIVTDPLGRRIGYVEGMGRFNEIPGALLTEDGGVEQILIPNALPGTYGVELMGVGKPAFAAITAGSGSPSVSDSMPDGDGGATGTFYVKSKMAAKGDVNKNGEVDGNDIDALTSQVGTFARGLSDPGDLDGDGLLTSADVILLTAVVGSLSIPPVCGNGVIEADEFCDDANSQGGDGCSSNCIVETCGDPTRDGFVTSTDALAILRTAVGGQECSSLACVCNVAGGPDVTSTDALFALRVAVGQPLTPGCAC